MTQQAMRDALMLILGRTTDPILTQEASAALRASGRALPGAYREVLPLALDCPESNWTREEREYLTNAYTQNPRRAPRRRASIQVRLTEEEKAEIEAAAHAVGLSPSDYARRTLLGPDR